MRDWQEVEDDASSPSDEDVCGYCSVPYSNYRGLVWIRCIHVTCAEWFCGQCNGGSFESSLSSVRFGLNPVFECAECSEKLGRQSLRASTEFL